MPGNSFGERFRVTTFGESHGGAVGVVVDGCPAGHPFPHARIAAQLGRRRPGQALTSQRKEADRAHALEDPDRFEKELKAHVAEKIGAIARPEKILVTVDLPKTRSGKIMRRLLRDIAEGRALGDVTTLADPTVVATLKEKYEEES